VGVLVRLSDASVIDAGLGSGGGWLGLQAVLAGLAVACQPRRQGVLKAGEAIEAGGRTVSNSPNGPAP